MASGQRALVPSTLVVGRLDDTVAAGTSQYMTDTS